MEDDKCGICREEIVEGTLKTVLYGCGHRYHSNCIMSWALRENLNCPTCGKEVIDREIGLDFPGLHKRLYDALKLLRDVGTLLFISIVVGPLGIIVSIAYAISTAVRTLNAFALMSLSVILYLLLLCLSVRWLYEYGGYSTGLCYHLGHLWPRMIPSLRDILNTMSEYESPDSPLFTLLLSFSHHLIRFLMNVTGLVIYSEAVCGT